MDTASKPLTWESLSSEKKKEISKIYGSLSKLTEFGNKANQNLFEYLYGKQTGEHLWLKFRSLNGNMLLFLSYLDTNNLQVLMTNIFGHDVHESNTIYAHT